MPKGDLNGHVTTTVAKAYRQRAARHTGLPKGHIGIFRGRNGRSGPPLCRTDRRRALTEFPSYVTAMSAIDHSGHRDAANICRRAADGVIALVEGT